MQPRCPVVDRPHLLTTPSLRSSWRRDRQTDVGWRNTNVTGRYQIAVVGPRDKGRSGFRRVNHITFQLQVSSWPRPLTLAAPAARLHFPLIKGQSAHPSRIYYELQLIFAIIIHPCWVNHEWGIMLTPRRGLVAPAAVNYVRSLLRIKNTICHLSVKIPPCACNTGGKVQ